MLQRGAKVLTKSSPTSQTTDTDGIAMTECERKVVSLTFA